MNLYELFNVSPSASHREIKKSYRRLLSNDELSSEEFAEIDEAYATLSDTQRRQFYDSKLAGENAASDLSEPLPAESQSLNPFMVPAASADTIELVEPLAEPTNVVDESIVTEPAAPDTQIHLSSSPRGHARGGRSSTTNSLRTIISCVGAAIAAGPIAILLLKFAFDKDPLGLWEVPPGPVVVRQPINNENSRGPASTSATQGTANSGRSQQSDIASSTEPPSTESANPDETGIPLPQTEKPVQPGIPLPQTEKPLQPGIPLPQTEKPSELGNPLPEIDKPVVPARDPRMPVPTKNELRGPLSRLEQFFTDNYKEAKANVDPEMQSVALVELAKTLFMNGTMVQVQDSTGTIINEKRIERYAWYQVALRITVESGDNVQVAAICKALSAEYQVDDYELNNEITLNRFENILAYSDGRTPQFLDAWKLLFQNAVTNLRISIDARDMSAADKQHDLMLRILKQMQPTLYIDIDDRKDLNEVLNQLFGECIENSRDLMQKQHFKMALAVLELARSIAIAGGGETEKAIAEKHIALYAHLQQLDRGYETAKLNYKTNPDDPRTNSALALYSILIIDDWNNGLFFLANGHDTSLATIARIDNLATAAARARNAPVVFSEEMKLAEQWQGLFNPDDRDINRKEIILRRTKFWYEQTIPDLSPLQKLEVQKILENLGDGFGS
jgi:hypothetical protein